MSPLELVLLKLSCASGAVRRRKPLVDDNEADDEADEADDASDVNDEEEEKDVGAATMLATADVETTGAEISGRSASVLVAVSGVTPLTDDEEDDANATDDDDDEDDAYVSNVGDDAPPIGIGERPSRT